MSVQHQLDRRLGPELGGEFAGELAVLGHGGLVGVDGAIGLPLNERANQGIHRGDLVAHQDHRSSADCGLEQRLGVSGSGADHGHGMHLVAEGLERLHVFGFVVRPDKGDQGDLVALCQVAQHIVGPHLGPGIQGVGQHLG